MLSEQKVNKILEKSKNGESAAQIGRELQIAPSTVKEWIKKGKYSRLLNQEYDFKLFEIMNDQDFANKYNIHLSSAQYLRRKYASHTSTQQATLLKSNIKENDLDILILNYIKQNNGLIMLREFLHFANKKSHFKITKKRFQKIAFDNDIKIKFKRGSKDLKEI